MNELKIDLVKSTFLGAKIVIDGVDILSEIGGGKFSLLPAILLYESFTKHPDYIEYYSNIPDEDDKTIIYSCNCLQIECGCIFMDMIESKDEVVWSNFENSYGHRYHIGPYKFTKENFQSCLLELLKVK